MTQTSSELLQLILTLVETLAVLYLVVLERRVLDVETRNLGLFDEYFRTRRSWYEARMRKLATDNASKLVQHGSGDSQRATVQPICADNSSPNAPIWDEVAADKPAQPPLDNSESD